MFISSLSFQFDKLKIDMKNIHNINFQLENRVMYRKFYVKSLIIKLFNLYSYSVLFSIEIDIAENST